MATVDFSDLIPASPQKKQGVVDFSDLLKDMPRTDQKGFMTELQRRESLDEQDRQNALIRAQRTPEEADRHAMSLTGRIVAENAPMFAIGPAAMAADALINAGYGAKKLGAKFGINDEPDPNNYYKGNGWLPVTMGIGKKLSQGADALGLDNPETEGERRTANIGGGVLGALSGINAGSALKFLGLNKVGTTLKANPAAQTASAAGGSVAGQAMAEAGGSDTGILLASLAGGVAPSVFSRLPGRQTIHTPEGQADAARKIIRNAAENPDSLLSSAEQSRAVADTRLPGFVLSSSAATKDRGLANVQTKLDQWSNDAVGEGMTANDRRINNNAVVRNEFRKADGFLGSGETERAAQNIRNTEMIDKLDLSSTDDMDITDLYNTVKAGTRKDVALDNRVMKANKKALKAVRGLATINKDDDGNITSVTIKPKALHNIRNELSETSWARRGRGRKGEANALRETQTQGIDPTLDDETAGGFSNYLTNAAAGFAEADQRTFMEKLAERAGALKAGDTDLTAVADVANNNVPVKVGKGTTVRPSDLTPKRQGFLAQAARSHDDDNWTDYHTGRNATSRQNLDTSHREAVLEGRGPFEKFVEPFQKAIGSSGNFLNRTVDPSGASGMAARYLASQVGSDSSKLGQSAAQVARLAGLAGSDPETLIKVLRAPQPYNPGMRASLALGAGRAARIGVTQGFLATERTSRYR